MRIVGIDAEGREVFSSTLPHGGSPEEVAFAAGYVILRPTTASRGTDGVLELKLLVRPLAEEEPPAPRFPGRDRRLTIEIGEEPRRRQRVAAYAVVTSRRGLLTTQYSALTAVDGRWGMPGGGLDPNEEPMAAVLREVHEETAQIVDVEKLHSVHTSHWIGRNPVGDLEDFHAVRLIYSASCAEPTDPEVLDTDGTTADAKWVPLTSWADVDWTPGWRKILTDLYGRQG
jgi:8-oxo-dGTP pyrophosphatase MutT (NUDIX family)